MEDVRLGRVADQDDRAEPARRLDVGVRAVGLDRDDGGWALGGPQRADQTVAAAAEAADHHVLAAEPCPHQVPLVLEQGDERGEGGERRDRGNDEAGHLQGGGDWFVPQRPVVVEGQQRKSAVGGIDDRPVGLQIADEAQHQGSERQQRDESEPVPAHETRRSPSPCHRATIYLFIPATCGMIVSVSRVGKPICVVVAFLLACLVPVAKAGDTYVLDRVRAPTPPTSSPGIVRLDSGLGQTRLNLFAAGPGVELPMHEPVGIDVNEVTHTLLVTDAGGEEGGYPGETDFGPCYAKSCGALLSIDPASGATTLLAGPGGPGVNRLENPYGVLVRPRHGDALVADQGTGRIISVDLATGMQSVFKPQGSPEPRGLRAPWGLAEDPTNEDILVANAGVANNPLKQGELSFTAPGECLSNRGFVLRVSSSGEQKRLYCDPAFRRPRDVLVNGDGTVFVVDPITEYALSPVESAQSIVGFGGVFQIDPNTGVTQLAAAGGSMSTPSAIDFNYAGTSLLLADETLFPFEPPCVSGCGGVIDLNPDGGSQSIVSKRGAQGETYVDPIAIAVDRDGQATPSLKVRTVPNFFQNIERPEGEPTTTAKAVKALPFFPVKEESKILILCIQGACTRQVHGKQRPRVIKSVRVPANINKEIVYFRGGVLVRLGGGKGNKKGHKSDTSSAPVPNVYEATVSRSGFRGRFQDFSVRTVPGGNAKVILRPNSGCLRPDAKLVRRRRPGKTVVPCPKAD